MPAHLFLAVEESPDGIEQQEGKEKECRRSSKCSKGGLV